MTRKQFLQGMSSIASIVATLSLFSAGYQHIKGNTAEATYQLVWAFALSYFADRAGDQAEQCS